MALTTENYRPGIGIILLNDEKKIFMAKRLDITSLFWQMPQGGIEMNETPQQAALRELKEEIGTNNVQVIAQSSCWFCYDFPDDLKSQLWKGRYRGQRQKWFIMKYLGKDLDINLRTFHPEFSEWQWMDSTKIIETVVPFKRKLYKEVFKVLGCEFLDSNNINKID